MKCPDCTHTFETLGKGDTCPHCGEGMLPPEITSCHITPQPKSLFDTMPQVVATFDDGETKTLFSY